MSNFQVSTASGDGLGIFDHIGAGIVCVQTDYRFLYKSEDHLDKFTKVWAAVEHVEHDSVYIKSLRQSDACMHQ